MTLANAYENMSALLTEAGFPNAMWRRDVDSVEDVGYFSFLVTINGQEVGVYMPGRSLDLMKKETLSQPSIYIDGNSWWWKQAVEVLNYRLAALQPTG